MTDTSTSTPKDIPEQNPVAYASPPLRCRFGWHPWPKWSKPEQGVFQTYVSGNYSKKILAFQHRTCPGCGEFEWRFA